MEGRIMTVEGTVEGRIMTDAKIEAVERIEDAASLVSGLLRFEPVCCSSQFPIAPLYRVFFIGPRYTWGPIYGSRVSLTE